MKLHPEKADYECWLSMKKPEGISGVIDHDRIRSVSWCRDRDLTEEEISLLLKKKASGDPVYLDVETNGLNYNVSVIQKIQIGIYDSKDQTLYCLLVDTISWKSRGKRTPCPNIKRLLEKERVSGHYLVFECAMMTQMRINLKKLSCSKTLSILVRKNAVGHGLAHLVKEILGVKIDKRHQRSNWALPMKILSPEQISYILQDILWLPLINIYLWSLASEEQKELLKKINTLIPTLGMLTISGYGMDLLYPLQSVPTLTDLLNKTHMISNDIIDLKNYLKIEGDEMQKIEKK